MTILTKFKIMFIIGVENMPRALTEQEKCRQCARLLEKGKDIVLTQGIRKASVDEITKAAGMAKGSFYQHFETKEKFLVELIWNIHEQFFAQTEQLIISKREQKMDLKAGMHEFLLNIFKMPELIFLFKNYHEINMLYDSMPNEELQSAHQEEVGVYEKLLILAGIDTTVVKPGIVHNYLHSLFLMRSSDLMLKDDLTETFNLMIDGLVSYIFGGLRGGTL